MLHLCVKCFNAVAILCHSSADTLGDRIIRNCWRINTKHKYDCFLSILHKHFTSISSYQNLWRQIKKAVYSPNTVACHERERWKKNIHIKCNDGADHHRKCSNKLKTNRIKCFEIILTSLSIFITHTQPFYLSANASVNCIGYVWWNWWKNCEK